MRSPYLLLTVLIFSMALFVCAQDSRDMASLRGTVSGTVQPARTVNTAADPYCATQAQVQVQEDDVIVSARPIVQTPLPVPAASVVLDRIGCRFVPHTVTLQAGQKLLVRNSDGTAHNAHAWPAINMGFNNALPRQGTEYTHVFQKEEVPFPIRDDVHNWEAAYVGVFSHPYHTVSKLNGNYQLALPAGTYEIAVWHVRLGQQTQLLSVRAGDERELSFVLK